MKPERKGGFTLKPLLLLPAVLVLTLVLELVYCTLFRTLAHNFSRHTHTQTHTLTLYSLSFKEQTSYLHHANPLGTSQGGWHSFHHSTLCWEAVICSACTPNPFTWFSTCGARTHRLKGIGKELSSLGRSLGVSMTVSASTNLSLSCHLLSRLLFIRMICLSGYCCSCVLTD